MEQMKRTLSDELLGFSLSDSEKVPAHLRVLYTPPSTSASPIKKRFSDLKLENDRLSQLAFDLKLENDRLQLENDRLTLERNCAASLNRDYEQWIDNVKNACNDPAEDLRSNAIG
jgi:hypothetical protein